MSRARVPSVPIVLALLSTGAAAQAPTASAPAAGATVAAAIEAAFGATPVRLTGALTQKSRPEDGDMVTVMMMPGMSQGEPFHGRIEILRQTGELLVASEAVLPGIAVLVQGTQRVVQTTTGKERIDVRRLTGELPDLLDPARLCKAVAKAEWSTTRDPGTRRTVAEAKLAGSVIRPDTADEDELAGLPPLPVGKKIEHVLARVELGEHQELLALRFTVVRFDTMHWLKRRMLAGGIGEAAEQQLDLSDLEVADKDKTKEDMESDVYELTVVKAPPSARAASLLDELRAASKAAVH